jgi:thioredoxin reductase (NADPH)
MERIYDLVIIGSGPSGMSAAVYGARAGLDTLLIEFDAPGGKMVKTDEIQNWPGVISINGADLSYKMYEHALDCGANFEADTIEVLDTDETTKLHTLTGKNKTYKAKSVILATGTQERTFDLPNIERLVGAGVSYCAICDGAFFREQTVAVFGGGNAAFEEALYLAKIVKKVYLVHRRQQFRAYPNFIKAVDNEPKIEYILDTVLHEILEADNRVTGVKLENVITKEQQTLPVNGIFIYIGSDARSSLLQGKTPLNEQGYVQVSNAMETAIPGVFAAGDVIDKSLRQVVTATNDGAIAAQEAIRYLEGIE